MTTLRIRFTECEHEGDLSEYARDVEEAGGTVTSRALEEDETATLEVEVEDRAAFVEAFRGTLAFDFSSLRHD